KVISLPSLIGWLSVCMLAAAWGHTLDDHWQNIWIKGGSVGLIAALMLERIEKVQLLRETKAREKASRLFAESRLAEVNEQNTVLDSVQEAIRQLTKDGRNKLYQRPLEVVPVPMDDPTFDPDTADSISGSLLKISTSSVSFAHTQEFLERMVLLKFKLTQRQPI